MAPFALAIPIQTLRRRAPRMIAARLLVPCLIAILLPLLAVFPGGEALAHGFSLSGLDETARPAGGRVEVFWSGGSNWLLSQQAAFAGFIANAMAAVRVEPAAFWTLLGACFAYGFVHAAGPGHGKIVVSSYLLATGLRVRTGVALAFAAAMLQALVAIVVVAVAAIAFAASGRFMDMAAAGFAHLGYAAVAAIGLVLVARKGRAFVLALADAAPAPALAAAGRGALRCEAASAPPVEQCSHCAGLDFALAAQARSWRELAAVVLAAGARPCAGALIVLSLSLTQGAFAAGVAAALTMALGAAAATGALAGLVASSRGLAMRALAAESPVASHGLRALELIASVLVLFVGVVLLLGPAVQR